MKQDKTSVFLQTRQLYAKIVIQVHLGSCRFQIFDKIISFHHIIWWNRYTQKINYQYKNELFYTVHFQISK